MIRVTSIACTFALAAACLGLPANAADLPRSGTYSGHYGWTFNGQVQELGPDRTVYAGVVPGVMCVVTDADGDKIFVGNTGAGWSDWKGEYRLP
jgi:hypothetical protein